MPRKGFGFKFNKGRGKNKEEETDNGDNSGSTGNGSTTVSTEYLYGTSSDDIVKTTGGGNYYIKSYDGNDAINASNSLAGEAFLGAGNDSFIGGSKTDHVLGGEGDDVISGGAGSDILSGGYGSDTIRGGAGNDIISGLDREGFFHNGDGHNQTSLLTERDDADALYGGRGNDTIFMSPSDTEVYGGKGSDRFEIYSAETEDNSSIFEGGAVQDFEVGADTVKLVGASSGGELIVDGSSVVYIDAEGDRYEFDIHTQNEDELSLDDFVF